jgi:hypothetical protein
LNDPANVAVLVMLVADSDPDDSADVEVQKEEKPLFSQ